MIETKESLAEFRRGQEKERLLRMKRYQLKFPSPVRSVIVEVEDLSSIAESNPAPSSTRGRDAISAPRHGQEESSPAPLAGAASTDDSGSCAPPTQLFNKKEYQKEYMRKLREKNKAKKK